MLRYLLALGMVLGTLVLAYILYVVHDIPNIDDLEQAKIVRKVVILDANDEVAATFGNVHGRYVEFNEIPRLLINAVIATEDRRFFHHFGVDLLGITRAFLANLKAGKTVQGGSTVTQQLAKILFLSPQRSLKRKVQEAVLAVMLEQRYTKEQIMAIYLNQVYLGSGLFGVDAAAKYYFGKNLRDINIYEAAIIAGLLQAPSRYSPTNNAELSGQRAYEVLENMVEAGFINRKQLEAASENPVQIETDMLQTLKKNYFANWVYDQASLLSNDENSNLVVKTTMNPLYQKVAERVLKNYLNKIHEDYKVEQGAVVLIDRNAKIVALVGGKDYVSSAFNRAVNSKRQPGSSFKLFVYATALERGYTTDQIVVDEPVYFGSWSPKNFDEKYNGEMTLEEAFKKSINTIAVKIANQIGVKNVIQKAYDMGVKSPLEANLSIALGTSGVSLLDMTSAFSTIANGGEYQEPFAIEYIKTLEGGQYLYKNQEKPKVRVLTEDAANSLDYLLTKVVEEGTGRRAKAPFKVSGKTGTSQEFRDGWFVGYSDKLTIGVWMGNDNDKPTKRVSGGTYPTIIAGEILKKIHGHH